MIPSFQSLMLPVLKLSSAEPVELHHAVKVLADELGLTKEEREELVPSGQQPRFFNNVTWAKTFLKQAGLLQYPRRGYFVATDEGRKVLASSPKELNTKYLENFEAFKDFQNRKGSKPNTTDTKSTEESSSTPEELLHSAFETIENSLATEILDHVLKATPTFFEHLILKLLRTMGYGGSTDQNSVYHLGRSGDNGVDGVINQDSLGVDQIYVQAKRYNPDRNVSSIEIQQFLGALENQNSLKGIFFTTSDFSKQARSNAQTTNNKRIILINGLELANLMVEHGVGCQEHMTYRLKKLDKDFFGEEFN